MIRVGLLSEGGIDEALLPPLLGQLVRNSPGMGKVTIDWKAFPFAPNGYGEIPKTLRILTRLHLIPSIADAVTDDDPWGWDAGQHLAFAHPHSACDLARRIGTLDGERAVLANNQAIGPRR